MLILKGKANKLLPVAIAFDSSSNSWLLFSECYGILSTNKNDEVPDVVEEAERLSKGNGLFAIGLVSYEASSAFDTALKVKQVRQNKETFPLISFLLFKGFKKRNSLRSSGNVAHSTTNFQWQPTITEATYNQSISKIKTFIRNGDTYQVNYTFRLRTKFEFDPFLFFQMHTQKMPPPYSAFVSFDRWAICSFSPELFFNYENCKILSKPMKGTRKRGLSSTEDLKLADELRNSEKERAENVMIVDMVRNDLAKIARKNTVQVSKLFEVEQYPTVWQMTSTIEAQTKASLYEILKALFPAASITGAPKPRTMEIINELETTPRKIYTGTIGWIIPKKKMCFNVAIRTVMVDTEDKTAEYGVGGGIVWDSVARNEFEECKQKSSVLFSPPLADFALLESIFYDGKSRKFHFLKEHIARMAASACYFGFPFNKEEFLYEIRKCVKKFRNGSYKIRVTLDERGSFCCTSSALERSSKPVFVRLARAPVDSKNLFLYHKTTNREIYEKAKNGIENCDDVLLWNEKREITESTIANVVYQLKNNKKLFTPPITSGLLPGTARERLIKNGKIEERTFKIEEIPNVSAFWLVNSVRGIQKAILLDKKISKQLNG